MNGKPARQLDLTELGFASTGGNFKENKRRGGLAQPGEKPPSSVARSALDIRKGL